MSHFGWIAWNRLHTAYMAGKLQHGLEREALKYLHRTSSLSVLAHRLAHHMPNWRIHIESIWIDGTPQASFTDAVGNLGNCELADLLLLVRREQPNGFLIDERSLLLQAKVTPRHNRLTSGTSTRLERRLFERVDRTLALNLHRDTARTSMIGSYILGASEAGHLVGLKDCARYVLAPKAATWKGVCPTCTYPPYQVGWPYSIQRPELYKPRGLVDTVLAIGLHGTLGRIVLAPPNDQWSQLVADLRGAYVTTFMSGYKQHRMHQANAFLITSSGPGFWGSGSLVAPPRSPSVDIEQLVERPPDIPVVTITLRSRETFLDGNPS